MVLKVDNEQSRPILRNDSQTQASESINLSTQISHPRISDPIEAFDYFWSALTIHDTVLAKRCVDYLNKNLNRNNAMFVLLNISKGRLSVQQNYVPSAPPLEDSQRRNSQEDCIEDLIDNLRNNCLLEIDKNGDYFLKSSEILELDYNDILCITTRDSLVVSSEIVVYDAVVKWGTKRKSEGNLLRNVLDVLIYAPRYGLMTTSEFLNKQTPEGNKSPSKIGILTAKEIDKIIEYIKSKSKNNKQVPELPFKMSQPRIAGAASKENNAKEKGRSSSKCEKHLINFLTCWTAVFD